LGRVLRYCPHCGCVLTKPRAPKAHRFFFAMIHAAYDNWPADHPEFHPTDCEQLRAWLLCRTPHSVRIGNLLNINFPDQERLEDFIIMAVAAVRQHGYGIPATDGKGFVELIVPQSIAFDKLSEEEFAPIRDDVFHLIELNTGMALKDLRRTLKQRG
jgi:hypothetical protein